jgi:hypothetical protein
VNSGGLYYDLVAGRYVISPAFHEATLDDLYPNHGAYVRQVVHATNALQMQGLLLPKDAQKIRDAAVH